ncbi:hypothetical protein, partial [Shigella flexneri]|uniref:hypothetical protein n=2 Tax=Shigella flexneri TaxID=623 RepID=UPI001C0A88CE
MAALPKLVTGLPKTNNKATGDAFFSVKILRGPEPGEVARQITWGSVLNRPGFPGECFICELRLPDHRFRWKHNKLFLLLPEEYGPAF